MRPAALGIHDRALAESRVAHALTEAKPTRRIRRTHCPAARDLGRTQQMYPWTNLAQYRRRHLAQKTGRCAKGIDAVDTA